MYHISYHVWCCFDWLLSLSCVWLITAVASNCHIAEQVKKLEEAETEKRQAAAAAAAADAAADDDAQTGITVILVFVILVSRSWPQHFISFISFTFKK